MVIYGKFTRAKTGRQSKLNQHQHSTSVYLLEAGIEIPRECADWLTSFHMSEFLPSRASPSGELLGWSEFIGIVSWLLIIDQVALLC